MMGRINLTVTLLWSALAFADQPNPWQRRCIELMQGELAPLVKADPLLAGSFHASAPDAELPTVEFNVVTKAREKLWAAVGRVPGGPARPWERDESWNYPVDPDIAWRESRAVPDMKGQLAIAHRAAKGGLSEAQLARFRAAARRAVDACIKATSEWSPPAGSLKWEERDGDAFLSFTVSPDGSMTFGRTDEFGAVGEMGTASAGQLEEVTDACHKSELCALAHDAGGSDRLPTLSLDTPKLKCTISLSEDEWRTNKRARACVLAVRALRARLSQRPQ